MTGSPGGRASSSSEDASPPTLAASSLALPAPQPAKRRRRARDGSPRGVSPNGSLPDPDHDRGLTPDALPGWELRSGAASTRVPDDGLTAPSDADAWVGGFLDVVGTSHRLTNALAARGALVLNGYEVFRKLYGGHLPLSVPRPLPHGRRPACGTSWGRSSRIFVRPVVSSSATAASSGTPCPVYAPAFVFSSILCRAPSAGLPTGTRARGGAQRPSLEASTELTQTSSSTTTWSLSWWRWSGGRPAWVTRPS